MLDHQGSTSCCLPATSQPTLLSNVGAVASVLVWCAAMALSARVALPIPGSDVPMTLQLLVVVLAGLTLSPARGLACMLTYLACGTAGLPVFAPTSLGLLGPTGGYLAGFAVGCWLTGVLAGPGDRSCARALFAGLAGAGMVLVCGVAWRIPFVGVSSALATSVVPFAPKAVVEVVLAVSVLSTVGGLRDLWRRQMTPGT